MGKDMKQLELWCIADQNAQWHGHFGTQFEKFLVKLNTHMAQQF